MYCLAGIGGRVEGILANTKAAARVLAIDGCTEECARKTLELAGFRDFQHLKVADMGFEKGKTLVTAACIRGVAATGAELLAERERVRDSHEQFRNCNEQRTGPVSA